MSDVRARIRVDADHAITGIAPSEVPPGDHEVTISVKLRPTVQLPSKPFDVNALPVHDLGPWPEGLSLRREDIYDEDGR